MRIAIIIAAAFAVFSFNAPARAAELSYTATLSGATYPTETASTATGTAALQIDTDMQTVDAQITVHGITFAQLSHHLAHSRMGPMHLHRYQPDGDVALILPFPFGANYAATADGFTVTLADYPYAEAAAAVNSHLDFADFLAALSSDPIYLNIHTEAFADGEISGRVAPAS